jgi:uncharacterized protein YutE (UPF0331/DUF86 family)
MDGAEFETLYERLNKNMDEIKELIKAPDTFKKPEASHIRDKAKYLFYSVAKSAVDVGHSIILELDLRDPLNRADIFISLAEHDILLHSVVPGIKKAVLSLPKLNNMNPEELLDMIKKSMSDIGKCLDSFEVYFNLKDKSV